MSTTVVETKDKTLEEICGFSAKGAWRKIRQLRDRYGSKRLSEMTGLTQSTINVYCSASYMKNHELQEETWEKYFGKWGLKDPVFPNADQLNMEEAVIIEDAEQEDKNVAEEVVSETVEKPAVEEEKTKARLILEVPKLEELEEALKRFGFKLIIE